MGEFIDERMSICVQIGAEYEDSYFVQVTNTANGGRYASLTNQLPYRVFDVDFLNHGPELEQEIASLYHRTYGGFAGFRVKAWNDYTTAIDGVSTYTALDTELPAVSPGVYQLAKEYGRDKSALSSIGRPKRLIYKPVTGEVAFGVGGVAYPSSQWSVDTATGQITTGANKTGAITSITQAASAIVTASNSVAIGERVHFSSVLGMTQINGLRGTVTAASPTQFTVNISTAAFSAYTSGGTYNTRPQAGETVTGGCEFDIPVAFESAFKVSSLGNSVYNAGTLRLVEILNP